MSNMNIKLDLLKLRGAFVTDIKGKTATKRCLVIPLDDARLFTGQKGVYLDLTAVATQESKYGDTHFVRQNLDRATYDALSEDERRAIPILGNVRPMAAPAPIALDTTCTVSTADDLPF